MRRMDPDLIVRIDMFLALLGLELIVAIFYMAINIVIGILCFVTVIPTVGSDVEGYRESLVDTDQTP
jgi:hypothetical protein